MTFLLCKTLLRTRSPSWNLIVFTFELKYWAVRRWYVMTQSCELRHFSSRKLSTHYCKIMFCSRWSHHFSGILHQVRLGPWLHICMLARIEFFKLWIWQWSCRPRAPLGDRLPSFFSDFWASYSGCAWLSCSQLQPTHWPEAARLTRRSSWSGGCRRTPWICRIYGRIPYSSSSWLASSSHVLRPRMLGIAP